MILATPQLEFPLSAVFVISGELWQLDGKFIFILPADTAPEITQSIEAVENHYAITQREYDACRNIYKKNPINRGLAIYREDLEFSLEKSRFIWAFVGCYIHRMISSSEDGMLEFIDYTTVTIRPQVEINNSFTNKLLEQVQHRMGSLFRGQDTTEFLGYRIRMRSEVETRLMAEWLFEHNTTGHTSCVKGTTIELNIPRDIPPILTGVN